MTCCTTLLADYFHGSKRDRYFGLQVVFTTVAATIFFGVGGALGAQNWRAPFWLYAVSLPLAFLAARYIWQPAPQALHRTGKLPALPWRRLAAPVGVTLLGGLIFYVLIVELSFKLDSIGVESPATIGAASAVASLGTAVGAFLFGRLAKLGPATTVPLAFGISGVGLVALALARSVPLVVVAAVVTGFGNGLLLPSLLTWALGSLGFEQRGRGTGVWTSALFIGQFFAPLVVLALAGAIGGLTSALADPRRRGHRRGGRRPGGPPHPERRAGPRRALTVRRPRGSSCGAVERSGSAGGGQALAREDGARQGAAADDQQVAVRQLLPAAAPATGADHDGVVRHPVAQPVVLGVLVLQRSGRVVPA